MYEVVCVGVLCADVLAKPVDRMPVKGKLDLIDELQLQIGGCAANAAIDLVKIGMNTAIIGKVGDDGFGKYILQTLKDEGVNVDGLKVDGKTSTSASVVLISKDGERSILHCIGSNAGFSFDDINTDIIKKAKALLIAGTFLMPGFDGEGTLKLLRLGRKAGVVTCLDTAWDSTGRWMKKIGDTLSYIDWFMPSYEEAKEMSSSKLPQDMAEKFISMGVKNVVIKLGKDGCYVKNQNKNGFYSPAFKNIQVVDTSGAGDSFCAGFITGLVKEWDIDRCARFANAVGANCVMEIGTTKGIKGMKEIQEFMESK